MPEVLTTREVAASDLLFTLGVVGAMKHFKLSHDQIHAAMDVAYSTRGIKVINRLRGQVKVDRLRKRVVTHEVLHPLIHRRLSRDGLSLRVVGKEYEVTHTWCAGILSEFNHLSEVLEVAAAQLLEDIEGEARSLGGVEYRSRARTRS